MREVILSIIKGHMKTLSNAEVECLIKDIEILIKMDRKQKLEER